MRVRHFRGQRAERRATVTPARRVRRNQRVDEQIEPLQRIDHRLSQDRQATFGEPLELPIEHFKAQLFLAAEVVVEVALPT